MSDRLDVTKDPPSIEGTPRASLPDAVLEHGNSPQSLKVIGPMVRLREVEAIWRFLWDEDKVWRSLDEVRFYDSDREVGHRELVGLPSEESKVE